MNYPGLKHRGGATTVSHGAGTETEQGSGERLVTQFLFWSHQQDQRCRLGRICRVFFPLSLSLSFLSRVTCMKPRNGGLSRVSWWFRYPDHGFFCRFPLSHPVMVPSFSVHTALFLTRKDALFKGCPVSQPSCLIQTPRAAPEFFPST